jgi:peptide/nickel transport system ATP-binding protein
MLDLRRDLSLTFLFISYDLSVVRYVSDTIGVMYLDKLIELGPADDVYYRPVHPYTKGLIDAVPVADRVAARPGGQGRGRRTAVGHPPSGCRFRTRCPRAQGLCAGLEPPLRPSASTGTSRPATSRCGAPQPARRATEASRPRGSGQLTPE